jgi:hypothetical protein
MTNMSNNDFLKQMKNIKRGFQDKIKNKDMK